MADKRIFDFPTLPEAKNEDLILVGSEDDTYNMSVRTLKEAALDNTVENEVKERVAQIDLAQLLQSSGHLVFDCGNSEG